MTAIADQSDIVTWSGSTWVVVLFLLVVGGLVWAFRREMQRAPLMDDQPSRLDVWDGVGLKACDQRLCTGFAVFTITDTEGTARDVCSSCFQRGLLLGWWVSFADRRGGAA